MKKPVVPASITVSQVANRVIEIQQMKSGRGMDMEAIQEEKEQLYVDVLHTIAHESDTSDKQDLIYLAVLALEAHS